MSDNDYGSLSGDDDLYGDDADSQYVFDDGDVAPAPAADAAAISAAAPAPAPDHMGTWQSDLGVAVMDATSTESSSLFTEVPADAKTYLQRVARREKQAALRCDVLRLRGEWHVYA